MEMRRALAALTLLAALALPGAQAQDSPAAAGSDDASPTEAQSPGDKDGAAPGDKGGAAPSGKDDAAPAGKPAGPCRLGRLTEMELSTQVNGTVTVPVTIDGQPGQMLVDTGAVTSAIADTLAIKLRLPGQQFRGELFELMGGVKMNTVVRAKAFSLGGLPPVPASLVAVPYSAISRNIVGILGANIMDRYDVELDFAGGKFGLFDPDHCPGQVVYWTHQPYAAVPFKLDSNNNMEIELTLDGKTITALVDTGAERSTMTMADFEDIFGYRAKSDPRMKVVAHVSINGTETTAIYRYPFQAMTLEGIQVQNPNIEIVDGDRFDPGAPKLVLGVETLRQLHMYIAYGESTLYLTAAEAR